MGNGSWADVNKVDWNISKILEEAIRIPISVIEFIIGRGGETTSSMQACSGCKVPIQKELGHPPGQTEQTITLQAVKQESPTSEKFTNLPWDFWASPVTIMIFCGRHIWTFARLLFHPSWANGNKLPHCWSWHLSSTWFGCARSTKIWSTTQWQNLISCGRSTKALK